MKSKKKKLFGFTLVELIVVMAIFSGIAVGALAMVRPAMQIFNKISAQEEASAAVDNVSRYIQDNLRYADIVDVYKGHGKYKISDFLISKIAEDPTIDLTDPSKDPRREPLIVFDSKYFGGIHIGEPEKSKTVYVMEISNDVDKDTDNPKNKEYNLITSIYKCDLNDHTKFNQISSISEGFYKSDCTFNIDNVEISEANKSLKLKVKVEKRNKKNTGAVKFKQESEIALSFRNISDENKFKYNVPATDNGGNIYIVYTIPEIINP